MIKFPDDPKPKFDPLDQVPDQLSIEVTGSCACGPDSIFYDDELPLEELIISITNEYSNPMSFLHDIFDGHTSDLVVLINGHIVHFASDNQ